MAKEEKIKEEKTNGAIDENKRKALESALAQIEKNYGKGSVMKLGDKSAHMNIKDTTAHAPPIVDSAAARNVIPCPVKDAANDFLVEFSPFPEGSCKREKRAVRLQFESTEFKVLLNSTGTDELPI